MLWQFQVNIKGDAAIHKHTSIFPQAPLPSRLPHNIEQSSLPLIHFKSSRGDTGLIPGLGGSYVLQILSLLPGARAPKQERMPQWEAQAVQLGSSPRSPLPPKAMCSRGDPAQPKIDNYLSPLHFTYDSESLLNFPQHTHLQVRGHDPENGSWALTQVTFGFPRQKKRAWFVCLRDIPGQRNFQLPWVSVNSTEKEWPILHLWVYFKKHTYWIFSFKKKSFLKGF